ncbi:MAG TPA: hypothetical protein PKW36_09960, partial [bacterium]|nr:hypothetical protein [bacterium]
MNALYTLMICFLFWSFATAQDLFYYGKGQKIPLSLSDKTLTIKFKTDVSESQMNDLKSSDPDIDKIEKMASRGLHKVSLKNDADIQGIISRLQINPKVERINPAYKLGEM